MHWVSWHKISLSKSTKGLGFRSMNDFNDSFLVNQYWRLLHNPNALWVRVLKSIYFPFTPFLEATVGKGSFWIWSSLIRGKDILKKGLLWRVGNGQGINIWRDGWVVDNSNFKIHNPSNSNVEIQNVCEL